MSFDLYFYWKLLLKRFPIMVLLITFCSGLGVFTALRLPETYATSARLLVEEPQIPDNMVTTVVRTNAVEQLDIIQQRLLTRANLIDIANRFDVFEDIRSMDPDTVVSQMRDATRIRRSAGSNQATLMTINFEGRSGRVVADVVNEYVTLVLEANVDFRMSRANSTLDFFEQEAERLGRELDEKSIEIATFKSENVDALPADQQYRLGRQTLLQERLSLRERDLLSTKAQRDDIMRIFETTGSISQTREGRPQSREEQQLVATQAELELLRSVYSDSNPRIIRLVSTLERLEAIVAAQNAAQAPADSEVAATPEEAVFQATMVEMNGRVSEIEQEIMRIEAELERLRVAISTSSANEIALNGLEREVAAIQSRYDAAIANLNRARVSERIETTSQGQRVTVIENANVPNQPSGPSRPRTAMMGAAVGFALAAGYFVLLEFLNVRIRRPAELVARFNVTPITTIPYMESRAQKTLRRTGLVLGTLIALGGVPALLWYIDTNVMPLDLFVRRLLSAIGIG